MKEILGKNFSYSGVYEDVQEDQDKAKDHRLVKRGAAKGLMKWDVTRDGDNYVVPYVIDIAMSKFQLY